MLGFSSLAQTSLAEVPSPIFIYVTGVDGTGQEGSFLIAITSGAAFIVFF